MKTLLVPALLMTAYSFAASAETYTYKCKGMRPGHYDVLKITRTQGFFPFSASYKGQWRDKTTNTLIFNKEFTDLQGSLEGSTRDQYFALPSKGSPDVIFYAQLRNSGARNVVIEGRQGFPNPRLVFEADNCVLTIKK